MKWYSWERWQWGRQNPQMSQDYDTSSTHHAVGWYGAHAYLTMHPVALPQWTHFSRCHIHWLFQRKIMRLNCSCSAYHLFKGRYISYPKGTKTAIYSEHLASSTCAATCFLLTIYSNTITRRLGSMKTSIQGSVDGLRAVRLKDQESGSYGTN